MGSDCYQVNWGQFVLLAATGQPSDTQWCLASLTHIFRTLGVFQAAALRTLARVHTVSTAPTKNSAGSKDLQCPDSTEEISRVVWFSRSQ